jgi:hypothetical protein
MRTFARGVGRPPTSIPATPSDFREALAAANPILADIKAKRWANAVADVRRAFEHLDIGEPRASEGLPEPWGKLKSLLPALTLRRRLARFLGFCATENIAPDAVDAGTIAAFGRSLEASPRVREPKKAMRATCLAWNDASRTVEGWTATTVPVPSWSRTYRLPPGALPETFEADLRRLHDRLSVVDLLDGDAPDKALRPATLATKMAHLRELAFFASAPTGADPEPEPGEHAAHLYLPAIVQQPVSAADGYFPVEEMPPAVEAPTGEAPANAAGIYLPAVHK